MGVYSRFKRSQDGFRALVELLETTPTSRRQKMIDVGMAEDPTYTNKAIGYMLTFDDVRGLSDLELAELIATTPARVVATAIHQADETTKIRFLKNSQPTIAAEIKSMLETTVTKGQIGGAQLKLIEYARKLEKAGLLKIKKIPMAV